MRSVENPNVYILVRFQIFTGVVAGVVAKHLLSVPGGCKCCGSGAGLPATTGSGCKWAEAARELLHGVSESWEAPGAPLAPMSPPQGPPEIPAARGGQELRRAGPCWAVLGCAGPCWAVLGRACRAGPVLQSRNGNVCISPAGAAPLFVLIRQFSVWAVLSWVCSRCSACS